VPGTDVEVAYVVTNGGETRTHCTKFHATSCAYAPVDGGTGYKLKCTGGVADLQCGAKPTCGNGIRESGEQCDGGVGCTASCYQGIFSCCQDAEDQCRAAPAFSLQYYLYQYCTTTNFTSQPRPGLMCGADGVCTDAAIESVPLCCQQETSCYDGTDQLHQRAVVLPVLLPPGHRHRRPAPHRHQRILRRRRPLRRELRFLVVRPRRRRRASANAVVASAATRMIALRRSNTPFLATTGTTNVRNPALNRGRSGAA
jgi:hypothetical protein